MEKIKSYILFLKKEMGLAVSLHGVSSYDPVIYSKELISFNIHDNPYCSYIKSCSDLENRCLVSQQKVSKCLSDGSFCGVCFAGVTEYIYPIEDSDSLRGFICVSGYKGASSRERMEYTKKKYGLSSALINSAFNTLKENLPEKEKIDTLIHPLCAMLTIAYQSFGESEHISFAQKVKGYLKQNRTGKITSEDLCRHFSCSRSYLSHNFKKETGLSIREYLLNLRLEDAKSLLCYSELNVTEIAFSVGFTDANYFSYVFKEKVGLSPLAYRKKREK